MNISLNFIPNKIVTFNGQDPPWFGEKIKAKIELKNRVYKDTLKMVDQKLVIIYG